MMDDRTAIAKDVLLAVLARDATRSYKGAASDAVKYTDSLLSALVSYERDRIAKFLPPNIEPSSPRTPTANVVIHHPWHFESIPVPATASPAQPPTPMPRWRKMDDPPTHRGPVLARMVGGFSTALLRYMNNEWCWWEANATGGKAQTQKSDRWLDLNGFVPTT